MQPDCNYTPDQSAVRDTTGRHPTDQYLRANGYTLHSRGKFGTYWRLGNRGTAISQEDALAEISQRPKANGG